MTALQAARKYIQNVLEDDEASVINMKMIDADQVIYHFNIIDRIATYDLRIDFSKSEVWGVEVWKVSRL